MSSTSDSNTDLAEEIEELRARLEEAQETLRAIRRGEVDALVVEASQGVRVYTLQTADHPYRVLIQQINEGAVVLSQEGFLLYSNPRFGELVGDVPEELTSSKIQPLVAPENRGIFEAALAKAVAGTPTRTELTILSRQNEQIPVVFSMAPLKLQTTQAACGILTDLRERKRNEKLERTEALARSIQDHATAALVIIDLEGRVVHANAAAEVLAGYSVASRLFSEAFPLELEASAAVPDIQGESPSQKLIASALEGSGRRNVAARLRHQDGSAIELLVSAGPFRPTDNEITGAVFTLADVTALRRAEESLRESEERFRVASAASAFGVWSWHPRTGEFGASETAKALHSLTPDEVLDPLTLSAAVIPEDRPVVEQALAMAQRGESFDVEYRVRRGTRSCRWMVSRGRPVESGEGLRLFATVQDITERKLAEQAMRESEKRFRDLAESIPQIVWTTTADGHMDYTNHRATEYFGMPVGELIDAGWDPVHPDDIERTRADWREAVRNGASFQSEYRMRSKDREYRWFLVRAVPIRDANGHVTNWFGTSTDIDAQKRSAQELQRANSDLEHFAFAASHDFQEPLRTVTAYAELLERTYTDQITGDGAVFLDYIVQGTNRMSALLQNLLAYMQASRRHDPSDGPVDGNDVVQEVLESLQVPIEQSGARVIVSPLPVISCPRIHLTQLFQNLLTNAIKYRSTAPPEISVSANRTNREWIFEIRDNGIGIAPEYQKGVFGVFKRLHGSSIPGSGIGLAICQRIIEQHNGRIWVESEPGKGSTFLFALPLESVSQRGVVRDAANKPVSE